MAKQKAIPKLEAEKAENERKLSQLQHKKQQLENRAAYCEKGDRRKRHTTLSPVGSHRVRRTADKSSDRN